MDDVKVTAFRYHGDVLEPIPADAEEALNLAERVFVFIQVYS